MATKKSATKAAVAVQEFTAYHEFEFNGVEYAEGDTFTPPAGMRRDTNFEEFRNADKKHGDDPWGVPFLFERQVAQQRNSEGRIEPVMDTFRIILPVQEPSAPQE